MSKTKWGRRKDSNKAYPKGAIPISEGDYRITRPPSLVGKPHGTYRDFAVKIAEDYNLTFGGADRGYKTYVLGRNKERRKIRFEFGPSTDLGRVKEEIRGASQRYFGNDLIEVYSSSAKYPGYPSVLVIVRNDRMNKDQNWGWDPGYESRPGTTRGKRVQSPMDGLEGNRELPDKPASR